MNAKETLSQSNNIKTDARSCNRSGNVLSGYPVICIVGRSRGCNDRFGRNAVPNSGIYRLFRNSGHFGRLYGNGDPGHTHCMVCVKCEKLFNRFMPDHVKFFFVPMLTLLVTLPVAMIFLGPSQPLDLR